MVVQVVPEGVDEVDGVVSGIGIGVTRKQDWKHERHQHKPEKKSSDQLQWRTKGDVSNVVPNSGIRVLQLQWGLPVTEQHLWGGVAGSSTLFEFLQMEYA